MQQRSIFFSGAQPSGQLSLGNYLGAMKQWVGWQADMNCIYSVVDMHSITVRQEPAKRRAAIMDTFALYLACGIDPTKSTVFLQSQVPQHAELGWILNCYTQLGELNRMTQFKDKSQQHAQNINAGLFCYPTLMAADILLYQTTHVPVGDDQTQHLELTRNIAERFNNLYGQTFVVPEASIPATAARVMALQDPTKKMSKSDDNPNNVVYMLDAPDVIMKKIKKAVTDSQDPPVVSFDRQKKPGVSNLLSILSALRGQAMEDLVNDFEGKMYGHLKVSAAEAVIETLQPIQARFADIRADEAHLQHLMHQGAQAAYLQAESTMRQVYDALGLNRLHHR